MTAPTRPPKARWLLLALAVLVADQWSKWLVELHLPHHAAERVIPGLLNLTHVRNPGVAFGLFASGSDGGLGPLALLGLAALGLVTVFFALTHRHDRLLLVALALVMGGAVGNLLDRLASGAVTDFVDVYVGSSHWPAFNVADAAITVGVVLIALDLLRPRRTAENAAREER